MTLSYHLRLLKAALTCCLGGQLHLEGIPAESGILTMDSKIYCEQHD